MPIEGRRPATRRAASADLAPRARGVAEHYPGGTTSGIDEETESGPGAGFCPVGFYVPDWWDVNDDSIIPGSEYWDGDKEWPTGMFGFVWGCHWGDDTSWKVQHLDLSRVQEGIIARDDRFGYVELATGRYISPCVSPPKGDQPPSLADFIDVERHDGVTRVRFAVELRFDLGSGKVDGSQHAAIAHGERPPETSE